VEPRTEHANAFADRGSRHTRAVRQGGAQMHESPSAHV
jgi:hypothetical protein